MLWALTALPFLLLSAFVVHEDDDGDTGTREADVIDDAVSTRSDGSDTLRETRPGQGAQDQPDAGGNAGPLTGGNEADSLAKAAAQADAGAVPQTTLTTQTLTDFVTGAVEEDVLQIILDDPESGGLAIEEDGDDALVVLGHGDDAVEIARIVDGRINGFSLGNVVMTRA